MNNLSHPGRRDRAIGSGALRKTVVGLTILLAGLTWSGASETGTSETMSLHDILRRVQNDNPSFQAAYAKWEMMKARVPQARAWEDPMFGVDVERMGTAKFFAYTDNEWMVSQAIPVSGRNLSRGRAAIAEAEAAFEELRRTGLELATGARTSFFRLASARGQLDINQRNEELLKQVLDITRSKYEVGGQSQADVLLAQTELAKIQEARADIERDLSDQESRLNVLMNRPAETPMGHPPDLEFKPLVLPAEKIRALALSYRPEIRILEKKRDAEKARLQLAHRQWIPEPELRVEARQVHSTGSVIQEYDTGIFFNVPWVNYSKYSAGVVEAKKSLASANRECEAARTQALGIVRDQLKKIETLAHHYTLFHEKIVPEAQQAVQSTRSGYEADKAGFLDVLTARRGAQEAESATLNHLTNYWIAIAELEALIGVDPLKKFSSK